jgi:hypothetical protein
MTPVSSHSHSHCQNLKQAKSLKKASSIETAKQEGLNQKSPGIVKMDVD